LESTRVPSRFRLDLPRKSSLEISEERLQRLIRAEVLLFSEKEPESISLRQVIEASTAKTSAQMMSQELPVRFAHRIQQIEDLPGWKSSSDMVEVHKRYVSSFQALRLADQNNREGFTAVASALKERMRTVIPHLAMGMRSLQRSEGFATDDINEWLDTFLLSRVGTEMLTSQYMSCVKGSSVVMPCIPSNICERAARHAQKLCREHFRMKEDVVINVVSAVGHVKFLYVPQYLFYIMLELLKNSTRATVESVQELGPIADRPVTITVAADENQIVIRIRDRAGGIPFSVGQRVWSYMYSTAKKEKDSEGFEKEGTPLAGYGVGLPLSRLYARYLGGELHLISLPGVGTSAYLYLRRIESEAREKVPLKGSSLSSLSDIL